MGAVLLAIALWCYFNFERVTEREFAGFSGEAARNPLLALQRLVERMGVKAEVTSKPAELDRLPPGAALILSRNRSAMTAQRVKAVIDWIGRGAHLIVEAEAPNARDAILDALRVTRREIPRHKTREGRVRLPGRDEAFRVSTAPIALQYQGDRESYAAPSEEATAVLLVREGNGQVTVLPSFNFMRNASIGEHDHAAFAWALVSLKPDTHRVLIAPRFEQPSLAAWLAREGRGPVIAAVTLLALWLWRVTRRFGPVELPREPARRRLLDHLRASGHFQWAAGSAPALLAAAREACLATIARRRPALADMPLTERTTRLAELTQLPRAEVEHAFEGAATTPRAFTTAVGTLQQIEEKLTRPVSASGESDG
jgi:hypothetical protein